MWFSCCRLYGVDAVSLRAPPREGDPLHNLAVEQGVSTHPTQSLRRRDFMQTYADLGAELSGYLKERTTQNIVIGGAARIGWVS